MVRLNKMAWLLALVTACCPLPLPAGGAERPNVLLIVSDDQGWPDLGSLKLKDIQTPTLDRLARYCGAVTCMDAAIGEILQVVREAGQEENTLVLFLSDNGGSGNGGNAPLRGQKSTMWEGGLRVPFLAKWPARIPAGGVTDEPLSSLEILPTLLAAAGVTPPPHLELDGFDMLPVLRREQAWRSEMDASEPRGPFRDY